MRHVAAYFLAVMGGNSNPSEADIKSILSSVGIEADSKNLSVVISQLKGKNIFDVMAEGKTKLAEMPAGGVGGGSGGAAPAAAAPVEVKEEKKPVEESQRFTGALIISEQIHSISSKHQRH